MISGRRRIASWTKIRDHWRILDFQNDFKDVSLEVMQIRQDSFKGDRPSCPRRCPGRVHRHDRYSRYESLDRKAGQFWVQRFLCTDCGLAVSVLPTGRLTYRALPVQRLQDANDQEAGIGSGPDPPPGQLEVEAFQRAWTDLKARMFHLSHAFGQMISSTISCARDLWQQIRRAQGSLERILSFLATTRQISLLKDYRCLIPPDTSFCSPG